MDALNDVAGRWCERQRFWHGPGHLTTMLREIQAIAHGDERDVLLLAALYHDAVYNPKAADNEEASAALLLENAADPSSSIISQAATLILASKWSKPPETKLESIFFRLDTWQLSDECPLSERSVYENAIFREYQWVSERVYRAKRAEFLHAWAKRFPDHRRGAHECLELLSALRPRIAVYPGSFSPFHLGHLSILRQAERTFDKVVVAVGVNRQKQGSEQTVLKRHQELERQLYFHEVIAFGGLLSTFLDELEAPATVVRGVRNGTDLEAELRFARFLNELRPDTAVIWISCQSEYQHLSSSGIRELEAIEPGAGMRYIPDTTTIYNYRGEVPFSAELPMSAEVHILGVRHHGPGSARSVATALEAIQPEIILLEGPPDAQELLPMAGAAEMQPPVAILIYRPDEPRRAVYYPFASFSPEWQAIGYGLKHNVQVRFMDLPQRHRLAFESEDRPHEGETPEEHRLREDPMKFVAQAAGYNDSERWWEEQFEKRREGPDVFKAVLELMTALREAEQTPLDPMEARREAWMRQTLREAMKEGFSRIAVVLGAWHGPALAKLPTAKSDADILKGMPKVSVAATWMPWTHRRLTFASGYGAGVHSPGYYEHLWTVHDRDQVAVRWMTRVAHLLRTEDLESSTASVIEATRLAETAAALRSRTLPGLAEFNEAAQAVFCFGDSAAMRLISDRLIVGDRLGTVPDEAQQVPLQRDLQKEQKRLRLAPEALDKTVELDLRKPNDLDRSRLLHRLRLLKVPWGKSERSRSTGTFREAWRLRWEPELEVALLEAAPWGNTVEQAATQFAVHRAQNCAALPELTGLVEVLLLAELPGAVEAAMQQLENQAALTTDVNHLMDALPALVNVLRYGNVRQTDTAMVGHVVNGLVARICIGLPPACSSLNEDAASEMLDRINATHSAISTLADDALRIPWTETLRRLADTESLNGLLAGRCCRILFDDHVLSPEDTAARLSRSLSRGNTPAAAAAWVEGFLSGSGLVLLHQPELWALIDGWITTLSREHFTDVLPLLRRTFSTFELGERRQMGEMARRGTSARVAARVEDDIDEERASRVLPTIAALLGSKLPEPKSL